jgi:hypothetical protein
VLSDPLFPWITAAWVKEAATGEDRFSLLEQRSQAYMRRVLQVVTNAQKAGV